MKDSRVVWTVLPNFGDENAIHLTLYASLIIQPADGQEESTLADVPPFDDWPTAIESVTRGNLQFIGDSGHRHLVSIADAETSFSAVDASRIWRALLPVDTTVQRYVNRAKQYGVRSYGAHLIENSLRKMYTKAARLAPHDYPDREAWKQILLALTPDDIREIDSLRDYFGDLNPRADRIPDRTRLPDFNAIVTGLSAYPVLQRRLGLAIDVRISQYNEIPDRGSVRLLRAPPRGVPFKVLSPSTEYIMKGGRPQQFQAYDSGGNRTLNGLLPIADSRYAISTINVESNANFFHNVQIPAEDDGDSIHYRLPSFTTAGITLLDAVAADRLSKRLDRTQELEQAAAVAPGGTGDDGPAPFRLDLGDISQGVRVDVFDTKSSRWMSLCRRVGEYGLGQSSTPIHVGPVEDEGMVTRGAAEPLDDERPGKEFFVTPSVFEWEGWSLCVDMPEAPTDRTSGTCKIAVGFTVPPGSLPRLRFGNTYRVRMRTVDLAGNSIAPDLADQYSDESNTLETTYRRIDPISSPQLVSSEPLQTDRGDSADVFVLRSNYNVPADEYMRTQGYPAPLRHLAPPEVEQKFAEKHGVFDHDSGVDPDAYSTIASLENEFADSIGPLPVKVPYLSDPLATRFQLRLGEHRLVASYATAPTGWPKVLTRLLRLREGTFGFNPSAEEYVVTLEKATSTIMRVSSALPEDLFPPNFLQQAEWAGSNMSRNGILEGDYWLITPYREIQLIHAVQQPLLEPTLELSEARDGLGEPFSAAGDTSLHLVGTLGYDGLSTGSADVLGTRQEWRDDPRVGPPAVITTTNHLFTDTVLVDGQYVVFGAMARKLTHCFDDTKTHLVRYSAVATTRFKEYFPQTEQLDFTRTSRDSDINAHSTVRRLSTARPPKPEIAYVVPILRQVIVSRSDYIESQRQSLSLRIYLSRPWFASGDDERIGLVVRDGADNGSENTCAWGIDPVRQTDGLLQPLDRQNFAEPFGVARCPFPGSDGPADILLYEVQYDEARQLWYADVRFADVRAYMPFVRLAILRYQPWSLGSLYQESLHASELAPVEYIQLLNDRSAVIRVVSVDGPITTYSINVQGVELHRCATYYQIRPSGSGELAWVDASTVVELNSSDNAMTGTIKLHLQPQTEYRIVLFETESRVSDLKALNSRQTYMECFELGELSRR